MPDVQIDAVDDRRQRRFSVMQRIAADLAEDTVAVQMITDMAVSRWHEEVTEAGGVPAGDPDVTVSENLTYGMVICDPAGEPYLDDDGEPQVDWVKQWLHVTGLVNVPEGIVL